MKTLDSPSKANPDHLSSSFLRSYSRLAARAERNLTKWGKQDLETLGLAIAEETGELCQAVLKARDEGGDRERIREETIDLGSLCLQLIYLLDNPPCAACDRGDHQLGHSDYCPQAKPPNSEAALPPVPCSALGAGDVVQRGDLFLDDYGKYLEMDSFGRLLGIHCLGQKIKQSGAWFRPLKQTAED